jgi:hypothetical protein
MTVSTGIASVPLRADLRTASTPTERGRPNLTAGTSTLPFQDVRGLLGPRPLRGPVRRRLPAPERV